MTSLNEIPKTRTGTRSLPIVAALCMLGLLVSALTFGPALRLTAAGVTDFISFYSGTQLLGSDALYDTDRILQVQRETAGWSSVNRLYCRPPYYALVLAPLGQLPYLTAARIWEVLTLISIAAFVLLWPVPSRGVVVLACCWSLPLFMVLAEGQDIGFVLVWVTLAFTALRRGRLFLAGVLLSLCAAKFHLFLMVPMLFAGRRLWRPLAGFTAGALSLIALSFAAGGRSWPESYIRFLLDPATNPGTEAMPNLHGMFASMPYGSILELGGAVLVAMMTWIVIRRAPLDWGFAAMLTGGLLAGRHAYLADCAFLIPACLIVLWGTTYRWVRWLSVVLLLPFCYVPLLFNNAIAIRLALLLLIGAMFWESLRRQDWARDERHDSSMQAKAA